MIQQTEEEKCYECDGTGSITVSNTLSIPCPKCFGKTSRLVKVLQEYQTKHQKTDSEIVQLCLEFINEVGSNEAFIAFLRYDEELDA